jgi:soluble lytic murein transglycosylase-like protein
MALGGLLSPMSCKAGEILSVFVETGERAAQPAREQPMPMTRENRLDDMDVYVLSPAAAYLRLPRMAPPEPRQQAILAARFLPEAALDTRADWTAFIHKAAHDFDINPKLIAAVIQVESAFQPRAISPKGARGLMQLMPATGESLGLVDPFDPEANIRAGARYLKAQLSRFSTLEEALAAYNAGPGNVIKYNGIPPFAETRDFVRRVMERQRTEDRKGFGGR